MTCLCEADHAILATKLRAGMVLQTATDEYIGKNEERFVEAAALLLEGREDLSANAASPSTALSLGKHW